MVEEPVRNSFSYLHIFELLGAAASTCSLRAHLFTTVNLTFVVVSMLSQSQGILDLKHDFGGVEDFGCATVPRLLQVALGHAIR